MFGTIHLSTGHYPVDDGWQNVIKKCPAKIMCKDNKFIDQAVKLWPVARALIGGGVYSYIRVMPD